MAIIESEFLSLTPHFDPAAFWAENERCTGFTEDKPRCALSFSPDDHWLLEFMQVPSTLRYYRDKPYRDGLHRDANAVLREHLGRAYFDEDTWEHTPRRIENLFGSEFTHTEGGTPWLQHVTDDPAAFARILDRAEATNMASWALPEAYRAEWEQRRAAGKPLPNLGGGSRGPATVMTSVLTIETVMYWLIDEPDLMRRFRDILATKMIELNCVLRAFSGNRAAGWWITDDNCTLFSPALYEEFCMPVLARVMDVMAPGNATRYQHSDSAMAHLLDHQRALGIGTVNYGPEVDVALIRHRMPQAMIHGHMPPFLLRNASPEAIRARIVSDFAKAGAGGGLQVTTAGSVNAGTGVGRMRWMMQCVQDDCRYAG
jgi:uroporphyrinogen decarboxylase